MKKLALTAFASLSVLALSACGKSDDPNAQASADTADMPAEETVNSAEANAQVVPDAGAATEAATEEQAKTKTAAEAGADVAKDFEAAGADEKKSGQ